MKTKLKTRRNNTKKNRSRVMYGGAPAPAPADLSNIFSRYDAADVRNTLNNFLQAAYSVYQASLAIKETSDNQNRPTTNPTDPLRGTRYLQRDSSASFTTATDSVQRSLNNLYMALSGTTIGPTLSPASASPGLDWSPPPSAFL
jgi:hypothetical protein